MSDTCIRRARSYWTTCHCGPCVTDRARKRKLHSMGREHRIPHHTAWQILADKFAAGWTARAVGSATGLGSHYFTRHIARWHRGEQCILGPAAAAAIMSMGRPTDGQVGAEPSRRRLRALAAIGYGLDTLGHETGIGVSTLGAIRNGRTQRVAAVFANTLADTYERLHMTPGPDLQARRVAREKKWPSPLAWTDIDADRQPHGVADSEWEYVDPVVVARILAGEWRMRCTPAEKAAVCEEWARRGGSLTQLERFTGWSASRYYRKRDAA